MVPHESSSRRLHPVVLIVVALLSACAQPTAPPDVITLAVLSSPNTFDPRVGTDEVSQKLAK